MSSSEHAQVHGRGRRCPAVMLDRFFSPRSIAIIGASPDATRIRGTLLALLRRNGYAGRIFPVNPSYAEIEALRCYPDIEAVGEPLDLVLIAIRASDVLCSLEACAAVGARHSIIISSGFAEEGGARARLQRRISDLARATGMRICGPNSEGMHNEIDHVSATFSPAVEHPSGTEPITASTRRIAIVAQSGGVGFSLYQRGRAQGLAFSTVVSTGNEADLSASDFLDYLVDDPRTAAGLLFLETVRDPDRFLAAASRAALNAKPIIAIKIGRTGVGERAALSHTASMAGWGAAYEAAFKSCGVVVASDPDEAIAIASALTTCPLPCGRRTCVVTTSGGAGAWAADMLAAAGLDLPQLSPGLQQNVKQMIPSYGSALNPVDITAQAVHSGAFIAVIELMSRCEEVDLIVVVTSMARETRVPLDTAALRRILDASNKPILFYSYTLPSAAARRSLAEAGAVILTALAGLSRAAVELGRRSSFTPRQPHPPQIPGAVLEKLGGDEKRTLMEYESKAILSACGLRIAPFVLARSEQELGAAAPLGYPLAAKIQSHAIPHKTDAGGVYLNIGDETALRGAYAALAARAAARAPAVAIDGVLIEPMAPAGIEMIIGVVRDVVFGPVLMVGAGGTAAALFRDVSYRLAPVDEAEARAMLDELRVKKLLDGYRGTPPADVASLAELIAKLSAVAAGCRHTVREIELNPVIVHTQDAGCSVVDALIVLEPDASSEA
jgi:acetate---CoA ligase (ADP-forming)